MMPCVNAQPLLNNRNLYYLNGTNPMSKLEDPNNLKSNRYAIAFLNNDNSIYKIVIKYTTERIEPPINRFCNPENDHLIVIFPQAYYDSIKKQIKEANI